MENIKELALRMDGNAQIIGLLSGNSEILNKVSRFEVAVKKLNSNQKKLVELHSKLSEGTTIAEKTKNKLREKLIESTMPIVRIIQVFAHDKNKMNLQRRVYFLTPEYVQNFSDNELIKVSKKIWQIANKTGGYSLTFASKLKSLLDPDHSKATIKFEKEYGMNPDMIKNLEEAIFSFFEAFLLYQDEMEDKENVIKEIKKINKKTKNLLANKIDRFALLFENDHPDFYKAYHELRDKQLQKQAGETIKQDRDTKKSLIEETPVDHVKQKPKPKTPQKLNPEKK